MLPFQGCIFLVNIDPSAHPEHEPCQICIIVLIDCIQQVRNFGFVSEIHVLHPTTIGCRGFLLGPYFIKNWVPVSKLSGSSMPCRYRTYRVVFYCSHPFLCMSGIEAPGKQSWQVVIMYDGNLWYWICGNSCDILIKPWEKICCVKYDTLETLL